MTPRTYKKIMLTMFASVLAATAAIVAPNKNNLTADDLPARTASSQLDHTHRAPRKKQEPDADEALPEIQLADDEPSPETPDTSKAMSEVSPADNEPSPETPSPETPSPETPSQRKATPSDETVIDFGYATVTGYDSVATQAAVDANLLVRQTPRWYVTHWDTDLGQAIHALSPGDVVLVDGQRVHIDGSFDTCRDTVVESVRDAIGDAPVLFQTCYYTGSPTYVVKYGHAEGEAPVTGLGSYYGKTSEDYLADTQTTVEYEQTAPATETTPEYVTYETVETIEGELGVPCFEGTL
jgi:hypothetical protein